MAPTRNEQVSH